MEADLARFYQLDYRDRWSLGRRLTLRRLNVLVSHLPPESSVATILRDAPHWSVEAHLLDDVRMGLAGGKPHPARPKPERRPQSPDRQKKLTAARRRARERRKNLGKE